MCHSRLFVVVALTVSFTFSVQADSLVAFWNEITLRAIRNSTLGPPMVARGLAIVHTSIYDAWAAYDEKAVGTRLGSTLRRPEAEQTLTNKEAAISFAAYRALVDLFPAQKSAFDGTMMLLGYDPSNTSTDVSTPQGVGNTAANAVLTFRHNDGANQLGNVGTATTSYGDYTGYMPVNTTNEIRDPNRWQPLLFSNGRAPSFIAPHWENVIPFALTNATHFRPGPPAKYPSAKYRAQAREVVNGAATLNDRRKAIAEYWADGPRSETPPGHWNVFAEFVSVRDGHAVDQDAKMFFALNNALLDVSIAVWGAKRFYDSPRPITAIRFLYAGKRIRTWNETNGMPRFINGEDWLPFQPGTFLTPPFAEYPSGHSAFSAASAEILKQFTGSDDFRGSVIILEKSSKVEPTTAPKRDLKLSWRTFSAAANEAGISRRYGGIHFRQGDFDSRRLGRQIGRLVWQKAQTYFDGTAESPVR